MKVKDLKEEIKNKYPDMKVENSDIIEILSNKGYEVKAYNSEVDDKGAILVREKYASNNRISDKINPQILDESTQADKSSSEDGTTKTIAGDANNSNANVARKKKKNIVMLTNLQTTKPGGTQRNLNTNPRRTESTNRGYNPNRNVVLGPNQMINKSTGKIMEMLPKQMPEAEDSTNTSINAESQMNGIENNASNISEINNTSALNADNNTSNMVMKQGDNVNITQTNQSNALRETQDTNNIVSSAEDRSNNRPIDRTDNRGNNRPTDRTDNRGNNRSTDRADNRGNNRPIDRTDNRGNSRPTDRTDNRGNNRPIDRTDNRGNNRPADRTDNKSNYRQDGRSNNWSGNRMDNRTGAVRSNTDRPNLDGRRDNATSNRSGSGALRGGQGNRPINRDRNDRPSTDNRPGFPRTKPQGGGRSFDRSDAQPMPEKNQDKRRNIERNKKAVPTKDSRYEDGVAKGRNVKPINRPGMFIKPEPKPVVIEEAIKTITISDIITIKELGEKMKIPASAIIKKLFLQGQIVMVNQELTFEEAENIAIEYDIICEKEEKIDVIEVLLQEDEEIEEQLESRAPVICVMGHVDHGKTSLLDAIRKSNVMDREAGGITQHIGAYTVKVHDKIVTFLDTPGHEAFTAMRMRGANATDIAILVVAADDGVMPQTIEAINHAKAAGIEIIVAVNKIDKSSANIDRVKQELSEYELIPEDWGGSTVFANVSAKSGDGIPELLEMIVLTSELLELKANPNRKARGIVIEAELDKGRGPVATILVQKGTLRVGDFVSAGSSYGKVRAMIDDRGRRVKKALPSTPVEILGLSDVPNAGDVFIAHDSDKSAKSFAETFVSQNKAKKVEETKAKMSLDDLFNQIQEGNLKELNLIVKADVQGSVEAVKQSLMKLTNEEVVVKCIHSGVGAINESDVTLAATSSAIIIGFNVKPDATAKTTAESEGVDIRLYKVIYKAIEDIEAAMKGMLDPVFEEKVIGHAEVRMIFKASALGNIAGSYVLDGLFKRGCKVRINRGDEQIYDGELASLKRFKDDVKEVKSGFECGLVFEGFDKMEEMDIVEAYEMVEVPR